METGECEVEQKGEREEDEVRMGIEGDKARERADDKTELESGRNEEASGL